LGDYEAEGADYEALLRFDGSVSLRERAIDLYHERLFKFDRALELDREVVQIEVRQKSATVGAQMNLDEAMLTAGDFTFCAAPALPHEHASFTASQDLIEDTLDLACFWGAGNKHAALAMERELLSKGPVLQKDSWVFTGTLHFLSISPAFEKGRVAWIALFTAVQDGDAVGMTKALHELEPLMQN
jgi:hypothetical protein